MQNTQVREIPHLCLKELPYGANGGNAVFVHELLHKPSVFVQLHENAPVVLFHDYTFETEATHNVNSYTRPILNLPFNEVFLHRPVHVFYPLSFLFIVALGILYNIIITYLCRFVNRFYNISWGRKKKIKK